MRAHKLAGSLKTAKKKISQMNRMLMALERDMEHYDSIISFICDNLDIDQSISLSVLPSEVRRKLCILQARVRSLP